MARVAAAGCTVKEGGKPWKGGNLKAGPAIVGLEQQAFFSLGCGSVSVVIGSCPRGGLDVHVLLPEVQRVRLDGQLQPFRD